jgi:hypothetical protein
MIGGVDVATLVSAVVAIAGGLIAVWQKLKASKAEEAFDRAEATLAALAVAIEAVPMNEDDRKKLKGNITWLAEQIGTEKDVLAPVVAQVTALAKQLITQDQGKRLNQHVMREAVAEWKAQRLSHPTIKASKLIVPMLLVVFLAGCCPSPPRLVEARLVPADGDVPALIVVAWPSGASGDPDDYITHQTMDGTMVTVAPLGAQP